MKRLHIRGLVRIAHRTRMALATSVSPKELDDLREHAADAMRTVDALVVQHGLRVEHLPAPTRNAYQYLAGINWDSVRPEHGLSQPPNRGLVRFNGLSSFFDRLLDQLGGAATGARSEESYASIVQMTQRISDNMKKEPIDSTQLTTDSRNILAWLEYFGQKNNFDRLVEAIRIVRDGLMAEIERCQTLELPVAVHFRPMKGLYRVRRFSDGVLVQLPTPMICFDQDDFVNLAAAICGDSAARQPVLE